MEVNVNYYQTKFNNKWININEVSEYTSLSQSTIRRAVKQGRIKASKVTGKLLFKISSIDDWLAGK